MAINKKTLYTLVAIMIIAVAVIAYFVIPRQSSTNLQPKIKITDFTRQDISYLFDINKVRFPFTVKIENQGSTDVSGLNLAVKILANDGGELGRDTSQLSTLSAGHQLIKEMSILLEINATGGKGPLTSVATIQLDNTTLDEWTSPL